ncbi:hypothetical protein [Desulfopila sp. IMCC35006]|uniref:hypothetical protein n=1 Tax=Desulfopila sp. IMCC35006 TaxID=2569542 RepID=UPI0012946C62|nr:hypothetical protein [Desulfopila sp. IMCC35006]
MSIIDIKVKRISRKEEFLPEFYDLTANIELHNLTKIEISKHIEETIDKLRNLKENIYK